MEKNIFAELDSQRIGATLRFMFCHYRELTGFPRPFGKQIQKSGDDMHGKKNIIFGALYLFFTLALALFLAYTIGKTNTVSVISGAQRALLSSACLQGNIDSILNIIAGYLICRLPFVDWLGKIVSTLMISGALLHSGMLYMAGFGLLPFALNLIPVGSFILIAVMLFMGIGALSIRITK